ncbi:MAG: DNA-binding response OmpR family regulator [Bacteroidia bacterium]|jgi:DNA-binding response OmpR family regulator
MSPKSRILVVEDDAAVRRGVVDALSFHGYESFEAADGESGLELALSSGPDLVLLDVMMPKMDGFEVLTALRQKAPGLPVILLTAKGAEVDKVRGLRAGADDYVVKPFSPLELLARVEAVLRRSAERTHVAKDQVAIAGRNIDFAKRQVTLPDGSSVEITERESELLAFLIANPDRAISREELLRYVWKINPKGLETRTVDMLVARLRERLQDKLETPAIIATVRGQGYRLANAPEAVE